MSRGWVIFKRSGKLLKFLLVCVVITVFILLIWRIFSTGTPGELKDITPNEKLNAAYSQQGSDLYVFKQSYDEITRTDKAYGYFSVPESVFIPDANQAQIVFRYNNSTITKVAEDKKLDKIPDRNTEMFDVSLVVYIDLTPEDQTDNFLSSSEQVEDPYYNDTFINPETSKRVRIKPSSQTTAKTTLYNFYKYEFNFENGEEALDLKALLESNSIIAVHTEVYYNEEIDYNEEAYGAIRIFDNRARKEIVKLSKKEQKLLNG